MYSLFMIKLPLYVLTKETGARELDCLQLGTREDGTANTGEDHGYFDSETFMFSVSDYSAGLLCQVRPSSELLNPCLQKS